MCLLSAEGPLSRAPAYVTGNPYKAQRFPSPSREGPLAAPLQASASSTITPALPSSYKLMQLSLKCNANCEELFTHAGWSSPSQSGNAGDS